MSHAWYEWRDAPAGDFAVIGDPVSHSLSPRMHQAAYDELGLPLRYVAVRVPKQDFDLALQHLQNLGYLGVNVTVPLKELAFAWSTGGDPRMGSANTIRFEDRAGTNTDAPGFLITLRDAGIEPCPTLILGAGGSARALCVALTDAGYEVSVWNRTAGKAAEMVKAARCQARILDKPDLEGQQLVVNTTSVGLSGESLNLDWTQALPDSVAYDLFYTAGLTPFLQDASQHGLKTIDGRPLLVAQGALALEWWTGRKAPRTAMMQAIL